MGDLEWVVGPRAAAWAVTYAASRATAPKVTCCEGLATTRRPSDAFSRTHTSPLETAPTPSAVVSRDVAEGRASTRNVR